ncbi:MAG: PIN domain-containing protein [Candidatus Micrarchaeota archaeon]|nr:PIN domain-containing protein [Candidatus Micrarchaeota archaeon]MDE1849831.1 PIN domain-containing protein [Candidatus Micrarchaeota archaeon]
MIIDTTYLLRLSGIEINTDLLRAIDDGKTTLSFDELGVSQISLFEIQAKVAKLRLPTSLAIDAIKAIRSSFRVEPFYNPEIIEVAYTLSQQFKDYIDCVIVATAVVLKEDLITEDTKINNSKRMIKERYKINILNYKEMV